MISKKQVLENNPDYKTLINAVISRIGMDSIEDVNSHGINGGFSGFIYYSDTDKFYRRYRKIINKMVFDMADSLGEDPVQMVGSFNCVKAFDHKAQRWNDAETREDIGKCIYGGNLSNVKKQIPNALAWFAAEEVCRMFDN